MLSTCFKDINHAPYLTRIHWTCPIQILHTSELFFYVCLDHRLIYLPLDLDSTLDERIDDPVARRRRFIRSLQSSVHTHTFTPSVNGIPPLPDLPAKYKPRLLP
ncbi:hypothetical protein FRC03_003684 [Tulasnella sp. 419]|nr:hypothetical protein FRC03_003684 [Tulasnella sp. 419]